MTGAFIPAESAPCGQGCGNTATVYAVDPLPGGWGGAYCRPCAAAMRFQVLDILTPRCDRCGADDPRRVLVEDSTAATGWTPVRLCLQCLDRITRGGSSTISLGRVTA